jgi:HEAT repeat protein
MRRRLLKAVTLLVVAGPIASALPGCRPSRDETQRKHLVARLRDARPAARILAIRELAPDADREETAAIARAAREAPADVRREIAAALGKSKQPSAIDFLGAMLRDPDDSVKAAAVQSLEAKDGERPAGYVVHAYQSGGPHVREAIAEGRPDLFRRAVQMEAADWRRRVDEHRKDGHPTVRADALAETGRDATEPIIAELSARLVDPDPSMAAAAAAGLANARATDQVPAIAQLLQSTTPLVVDAAAVSLRELGAQPAADNLAAALERSSGDAAGHILDALEDLKLTPAATESLCRVATGHADGLVALRAARLVSDACTIPVVLPEAPKDAGPRLLVLAAFNRRDPAALRRARTLLDDLDARVGADAAAYLGRCGGPSDATALVNRAQSGLAALVRARAEAADRAKHPAQTQDQEALAKQLAMLREVLGESSAEKLAQAQPRVANKLAQLIEKRRSSATLAPVEDRPGAIDLLSTAAIAAAHLHGNVSGLADSLLSDPEPSVRAIAPEIADFLGDTGEPLRVRLRQDADPEVRLRMAALDLQAGREGALDRLAQLAADVDPGDRTWIAEAVSTHATEAKPLLITLLDGGGTAAPVAARALASIQGEDVDKALIRALDANQPVTAYAALVALRGRAGPAVEHAIEIAAVNPSPDIREAAVQQLADRKACGLAQRLLSLDADYSGAVRAGVSRLQGECGH